MKMRISLLLAACVALTLSLGSTATVFSREINGGRFVVTDSVDSVELIGGTSRRLKFDYKVPELMIENPEIISATPVAPNEILISGIKPGVSTITVSDADKNLQTIRVHVTVDTRQLEMAFKTHFPDSQIKVHALQTGVLLGGNVARADQVSNIMSVARDFFPTGVVNQMQVNGSQNIAIKVKIYEVSRTKLRAVGVDWSLISDDFNLVSSVSDLIATAGGAVASDDANFVASVVRDNTSLNAAIQFLEQRNVAKLLDEPVLVAQNGRPAEFLSGGEIPIAVASGLGTNSVDFRPFGTKLDIVPLVHGQGLMTLEVRAEVSEVAEELATAGGTPGFRVRRINTGVKMRAGHTLALAGDYQERDVSQNKGVPKLMDSPLFGGLFRKIQDEARETELVFLITPQFVSDVDAEYAKMPRPGSMTDSPSDHDLFINGHLEVPECGEDCPINQSFDNGRGTGSTFPQSQPFSGSPQPGQYQQYPESVHPPVNSRFESSFNFPGNGSSRREAASVADAESGSFGWPTDGTQDR